MENNYYFNSLIEEFNKDIQEIKSNYAEVNFKFKKYKLEKLVKTSYIVGEYETFYKYVPVEIKSKLGKDNTDKLLNKFKETIQKEAPFLLETHLHSEKSLEISRKLSNLVYSSITKINKTLDSFDGLKPEQARVSLIELFNEINSDKDYLYHELDNLKIISEEKKQIKINFEEDYKELVLKEIFDSYTYYIIALFTKDINNFCDEHNISFKTAETYAHKKVYLKRRILHVGNNLKNRAEKAFGAYSSYVDDKISKKENELFNLFNTFVVQDNDEETIIKFGSLIEESVKAAKSKRDIDEVLKKLVDESENKPLTEEFVKYINKIVAARRKFL